ncbi:MAG: cupin domain-containing protein [Euryarchaeota archaeon]|nr:cupin domain-containing protein [Euryarchaeota archaeon]
MKLLQRENSQWRSGLGYEKRVLVGRELFGDVGTLLQEVRFRKGEKVPFHYHTIQTEVFFALDEIDFVVNGNEVHLKPGDMLVCEPGDVHGRSEAGRGGSILVLKLNFPGDDDIHWIEEVGIEK